jgi:predicted RNA-binding Zn-ribbon protein involved in translation (DUF1610 family)
MVWFWITMWVLQGGLTHLICQSKNRPNGFWLGFLLGPIGIIVAVCLSKLPDGDDPLVAAWEAEKTTKKCPDCAETILADAKVCKHCGFRFAPKSTPNAPSKQLPPKSTKVKCHHCQHVQLVPVHQQLFNCEECGTKLRRRTTEVN